jgi:AcrR family transcriptional regulator
MSQTRETPTRSTYRHGDLRRALLEAGVELARAGGPEAVTLREATRRAGVVPNAAYRHFASHQDLLHAVRSLALGRMAGAMEAELAALPPSHTSAEAARVGLRAIGTGYLRFARSETGLFRTAFAVPLSSAHTLPEGKSGASGLDPFELLGRALDRMVAAGVLPAERRVGSEYLAWSAVHGLAMLVIEGPLNAMDGARIDALLPRLLDMVENGL